MRHVVQPDCTPNESQIEQDPGEETPLPPHHAIERELVAALGYAPARTAERTRFARDASSLREIGADAEEIRARPRRGEGGRLEGDDADAARARPQLGTTRRRDRRPDDRDVRRLRRGRDAGVAVRTCRTKLATRETPHLHPCCRAQSKH